MRGIEQEGRKERDRGVEYVLKLLALEHTQYTNGRCVVTEGGMIATRAHVNRNVQVSVDFVWRHM